MPILLSFSCIFVAVIVPISQLKLYFMDYSKITIDFTQEQFKLLAIILSNYLSIISRIKISHPSIGYECELAEVLALYHELSIHFSSYYGNQSVSESEK